MDLPELTPPRDSATHSWPGQEQSALWLSDTRYYHCTVTRDLLGDQVITVAYGGRWSKRGRTFSILVQSDEEAAQHLTRIGKTRLAHGYHRCETLL